jgi:hypothetical protein
MSILTASSAFAEMLKGAYPMKIFLALCDLCVLVSSLSSKILTLDLKQYPDGSSGHRGQDDEGYGYGGSSIGEPSTPPGSSKASESMHSANRPSYSSFRSGAAGVQRGVANLSLGKRKPTEEAPVDEEDEQSEPEQGEESEEEVEKSRKRKPAARGGRRK